MSSPTPSPAILSPAERLVLHELCQAFLPALVAEPGDDARLFSLDAAAVGVAPAVEEAIGHLDHYQQVGLRRFLRLLDRPIVNLLLAGQLRALRHLPQDRREQLLWSLATSRWGAVRRGFQAVKRLSTFLFCSLPGPDGTNPTWPALGYTPAPGGPAAPPALALTPITAPTTLTCDVCVIGSGAGGGVIAAELAAAGKKAIVLEAGPGPQAPDYDQRELPGIHGLYLDRGMTTSADLGIAVLAGATLGGGTAVNWQTCLELPANVRAEWVELSGCSHFAEESFRRSFEAVSRGLNVGTDESVVNRPNALLRDGCAALGYGWQPIPRNARGCEPSQCGYCVYGCRHGGKQSTAVTFLRDAQQQGDARIIAGCRADRVRIERSRVVGVDATVLEPGGNGSHPVFVRADTVVAAAGALYSPALLWRSGVRLPALGRNLFLHPTGVVAASYDEPVEGWKGPPQSILCDEFAELAGPYGFRLEVAPTHPGMIALAVPWTSAREHRRGVQQAAHCAALIALVRDRRPGRLWFPRHGRPIIAYRPGPREQAHLRQGIATAARVHLAAGARAIRTLHTRPCVLERGASPAAVDAFYREVRQAPLDRNRSLLFSAHQMGTCRMGRDARTAVCDANGQVFGVRGLYIGDGSAFPASSGVNPMLTIMALAHHTAQRMKEDMMLVGGPLRVATS
jgi:choline dehydrogenase-like flavoprotein